MSSIVLATCYAVVSTWSIVCSKIVLDLWPAPNVLLLVQAIVCIVILIASRFLGIIHCPDMFKLASSSQRSQTRWLISVLYTLNTTLSLWSLDFLTVPMFSCLKRTNVPVSYLLELRMLEKPSSSSPTTSGAVLANGVKTVNIRPVSPAADVRRDNYNNMTSRTPASRTRGGPPGQLSVDRLRMSGVIAHEAEVTLAPSSTTDDGRWGGSGSSGSAGAGRPAFASSSVSIFCSLLFSALHALLWDGLALPSARAISRLIAQLVSPDHLLLSIAVSLMVIGAFAASWFDLEFSLIGILLALGSATCQALSLTLAKQQQQQYKKGTSSDFTVLQGGNGTAQRRCEHSATSSATPTASPFSPLSPACPQPQPSHFPGDCPAQDAESGTATGEQRSAGEEDKEPGDRGDIWAVLFFNSVSIMVIMFFFTLASGELSRAAQLILDSADDFRGRVSLPGSEPHAASTVLWLGVNGLSIFGLNALVFAASTAMTPLTVMIIGNMKSVATIIVGILVFKKRISTASIVGLVINLLGGAIYSAGRYRQKRARSALAISKSEDAPS